MTEESRPYETQAQHVTRTGFECVTCGTFYGEDIHAARSCHATNLPCGDCGAHVPKGRIRCAACQVERDQQIYASLEEVEWDGKTPLVEFHGNAFFFSADDVNDWLEWLRDKDDTKRLNLVICEQIEIPVFSMAEFLYDTLPDEVEPPVADHIERLVNEWITANVGNVWTAGQSKPSLNSLRAAGIWMQEEPTDE